MFFGIWDPGSGMGKNPHPGSGINIPDPQHWTIVKKNSTYRSNWTQDQLVRNPYFEVAGKKLTPLKVCGGYSE
jgi:hypothetical protein